MWFHSRSADLSTIAESKQAPHYWDTVAAKNKEKLRLDCWREYMKYVYCRLMEGWFAPEKQGSVLKTDLFEEALTSHSLLPEMGKFSFGMDHSIEIARSAKEMLTRYGKSSPLVVCDLRRLPFQSGSIHQVLSPSSLDHFAGREEIAAAISDLSRILKPGGILILTLDNPHNPVVWLRNALPFAWMNRIGLVPYYVGPTCTMTEAKNYLRAAGLKITDWTSVAHAPRVPAIWLSMLEQKINSRTLRRLFRKGFAAWEILQKLPTRYQTGYYIAIRAVK